MALHLISAAEAELAKLRAVFHCDLAHKIEHAIEDLAIKIIGADQWGTVLAKVRELATSALANEEKRNSLAKFIAVLLPTETPGVVANLLVELAVAAERKAFAALYGTPATAAEASQ